MHSTDTKSPPLLTTTATARPVGRSDFWTIGTLLGLTAAVSYSLANLCLRKVSLPNDLGWAIWVSCVKSSPAAALAWMIIGWRASKGLAALPPTRLWLPLMGGGLLMQFGGNVMFQWALGIGGLIVTVPVVFAAIITTGAWLGRIFLKDELTRRTTAAIAVLLAAIVVIAIGAVDATAAVAAATDFRTVATACLVATLSGIAYGANGVFIRHVLVSNPISLSATLVMFCTTGTVVLGITSIFTIGPTRMLGTTPGQWMWMLGAGSANALAFFAVGAALKRLSVNRVNLLNATQNAICALGGVWLFAEPFTIPLMIGCGLTIGGILLMDHRKQCDEA
jgi:DME family drug/metabolite transporter